MIRWSSVHTYTHWYKLTLKIFRTLSSFIRCGFTWLQVNELHELVLDALYNTRWVYNTQCRWMCERTHMHFKFNERKEQRETIVSARQNFLFFIYFMCSQSREFVNWIYVSSVKWFFEILLLLIRRICQDDFDCNIVQQLFNLFTFEAINTYLGEGNIAINH